MRRALTVIHALGLMLVVFADSHGDVKVLDGNGIGSSEYYDNFNAQFLHKLPTGWHTFEVYTDCGQDVVKFWVN